MYFSLEILELEDGADARSPKRLRRLVRNRCLSDLAWFFTFLGVTAVILAALFVEIASGASLLVGVVAAVPAGLALTAAARRAKKLRQDPIAEALRRPDRFEAADARIVDTWERKEGYGQYSYDVVDVTVEFRVNHETIRATDTFDRSVWHFNHRLPVPATALYERDAPSHAALIALPRALVHSVPKNKRSAGKGFWIGVLMTLLMLLLSLAFFAGSCAMLLDHIRGRYPL